MRDDECAEIFFAIHESQRIPASPAFWLSNAISLFAEFYCGRPIADFPIVVADEHGWIKVQSDFDETRWDHTHI